MRPLYTTTCLTPIALLAATAALAETTISDDRTTAVATSTASSGVADDIAISEEGSITLASGTAVTIDSNNSVSNEGTIAISDADGATGIAASGGLTGSIANSGTITIDEDYTGEDDDDDGDVDGSFASGADRYGIHVGGTGAFTGDISNSGTITVEGNDSAGIAVDGPLAGSLDHSGTIAVTGDGSTGIRLHDVTGNISVTGSVYAVGEGAEGVSIDGDVGGMLTVQNSITATGYRSTSLTSDEDELEALDADDLLQGGSALRVTGNVAGGILFDAAPSDEDDEVDDEDGDGIDDSEEGTAGIYSYGGSPAVAIGSATEDIAIGAIAGRDDGAGIVNKGVVGGFGVYAGVAATGMAIGGTGGAVDVAGGIVNDGTIYATTNGAAATGLSIGSAATIPSIVNNGTISATDSGETTVGATALLIDQGATVTTLTNTGSILASLAEESGTATAVKDLSGTLSHVVNSGSIGFSGASETGVAFDLSANVTGVTLEQLLDEDTSSSGPTITGNVLTGSGDDLIDLADGRLTGDLSLAGGADTVRVSGDTVVTGDVDLGGGGDSLALSDSAALVGDVTFGAGSATMTISDDATFSGALLGNTAGLSFAIENGALDLTNTGTLALSALSLGSGSVTTVTIDPVSGTSTLLDVTNGVEIASGAQLKIKFAQLLTEDGSYTVIRAGSLEGGENLTIADATLPYLYTSSVAADEAASTVDIIFHRKTTDELGLNRSGSAIYDAVYAAASADTDIAASLVNIFDKESFVASVAQFMPDHSGGVFELVTQGSSLLARSIGDPSAPRVGLGGSTAFWLQQFAWGSHKDTGDTSGYDATGWGAAGGYEFGAGALGTVGVSLAYMRGLIDDDASANGIATDQFELAGYWRGDWKGWRAYARGAYAYIDLHSDRFFSGSDGETTIHRTTTADWGGSLLSFSAGLTREFKLGRIAIRPGGSIDYYSFSEGAHTESGGGTGFDLSVDSRKSDELAASTSLALGLDFGGRREQGDGWGRIEVEGGYRSILGGSLGATTARFAGGADFTLLPDQRQDGMTARLRALGGNDDFRIGGELGFEERQDHNSLSARVSLNLPF